MTSQVAAVIGESRGGGTGRYNVFAELACGGMAMVYLGQLEGEHGFRRSVAIKRMHAQYTRDQEFRDMFLDEARLVAKIRHPNVVPTLDIVSREDVLLLVMEFIEGESVAQLLSSTKMPVPARIATAIAHDTLCGLHAAHELRGDDGKPLNVIHRDVSPANILVGIDGLSRILDFGVAKAAGRSATTKDGSIKGKVPYMPPEQLWGSELDRTCDTYATAVCLWEMLTGRRLFRGDSEAETMRLVVEEEVPPPSTFVPEAAVLDAIVMRGLSRDPSKRFQTALEMAKALEKALPPSSRLETGEWVSTVASATLARRSELLQQMQRGAAPPAPFDVASIANVLTTATSRTAIGQALSQRQAPAKNTWVQNVAIAATAALVVAAVGGSFYMRGPLATAAAGRSAAKVTSVAAAEPPPAAAMTSPITPSEPAPASPPPPAASAPEPRSNPRAANAPKNSGSARGAGPAQRVAASPASRPAPASPAGDTPPPKSDAALGSRY